MTKFASIFLCKFPEDESPSLEDLDLHESEKKRFQEMKSSKKAREFLLSRFVLQEILQKEFDLDLKVFQKISEQPSLVGSPIFMSMSHSAEYLLFGFSDQNIGVDIETKTPKSDALSLAKKYFANLEQEYLEAQSSLKDRDKAFQLLWSLKEAYFKFLGENQSIPKVNELAFDLANKRKSVSLDLNFIYQESSEFCWSICMEKVPISFKVNVLGEKVSNENLNFLSRSFD